jgi:hypothetical protein
MRRINELSVERAISAFTRRRFGKVGEWYQLKHLSFRCDVVQSFVCLESIKRVLD